MSRVSEDSCSRNQPVECHGNQVVFCTSQLSLDRNKNPRKPTGNLKIPPCKRRNTSKPPIFGLTVHFRIQKRWNTTKNPRSSNFMRDSFLPFQNQGLTEVYCHGFSTAKMHPFNFNPICIGHAAALDMAEWHQRLRNPDAWHMSPTLVLPARWALLYALRVAGASFPHSTKTTCSHHGLAVAVVVAKSTCFDHLYLYI